MHGALSKPVQYILPVGEQMLPLNPMIGKHLKLVFTGAIYCTACKRRTPKSYNGGYCYTCSRTLAECDICIVRPELCRFDAGGCRQPEWGRANCLQPHYVYLANASNLKVGVTRLTQTPTRWIDQGAIQALPMLKTATRHQAGVAEVILKNYVSDKTHWRTLVRTQPQQISLLEEKERLLKEAAFSLAQAARRFGDERLFQPLSSVESVEIHYPILKYQEKPIALSFDKTPEIAGTLIGVKGQYLMLDYGVLNIRKFRGYEIISDE